MKIRIVNLVIQHDEGGIGILITSMDIMMNNRIVHNKLRDYTKGMGHIMPIYGVGHHPNDKPLLLIPVAV